MRVSVGFRVGGVVGSCRNRPDWFRKVSFLRGFELLCAPLTTHNNTTVEHVARASYSVVAESQVVEPDITLRPRTDEGIHRLSLEGGGVLTPLAWTDARSATINAIPTHQHGGHKFVVEIMTQSVHGQCAQRSPKPIEIYFLFKEGIGSIPTTGVSCLTQQHAKQRYSPPPTHPRPCHKQSKAGVRERKNGGRGGGICCAKGYP